MILSNFEGVILLQKETETLHKEVSPFEFLFQLFLLNCAIHEVFVAERAGIESFYLLTYHIDVSVEIDRSNAACSHDHIFS